MGSLRLQARSSQPLTKGSRVVIPSRQQTKVRKRRPESRLSVQLSLPFPEERALRPHGDMERSDRATGGEAALDLSKVHITESSRFS